MNLQSTILLMPIVGILLVASYGFGATLATPSQVNQFESLKILTDTSKPLIEMDLGTKNKIDSIVFSFDKPIKKNTTISVTIEDYSGLEIGSGAITLSARSDVVIVVLADIVEILERPDMAVVKVSTWEV